MEALDTVDGNEFEEASERLKFWELTLYEWEVPEWFQQNAKQSYFNWKQCLPPLQRGRSISTAPETEIPQMVCDNVLSRLCANTIQSLKFEESNVKENLLSSLLADGKAVNPNNPKDLVELEQGISTREECSRLETDLLNSNFPRRQLIVKHLRDAEDLLRNKAHACIGEVRCAFEAVVEDAATIVMQHVPNKPGTGLTNVLKFLSREKVLTQDECEAFDAAWRFLSAGAHPGIPEAEQSRISFILAVEFIQVIRMKIENIADLVRP